MFVSLGWAGGGSWAFLRDRAAPQIKIRALRHQLSVLQQSVKRLKLTAADWLAPQGLPLVPDKELSTGKARMQYRRSGNSQEIMRATGVGRRRAEPWTQLCCLPQSNRMAPHIGMPKCFETA